MGAYAGTGCTPTGGAYSPIAFILILFILLAIIWKAGFFCC